MTYKDKASYDSTPPCMIEGLLNVTEPTGVLLMNSKSNSATSRPVLYHGVLQCIHDLESTTQKLRHVQRKRAHGRAAHDSQQQ